MKKLSFTIIALLLTFTWQLSNAQEQEPEWARVLQLNTYGNQIGQLVTADEEYVYMAGTIMGPVTFEGNDFVATGFYDMILAKVSATGVTSWVQQITAQEYGSITPNAIKTDASGNVYVSGLFSGAITAGTSTVFSTETINAFILKFNSNGNGLWITSFESSGSGSSEIAVDGSGNSFLLSRTMKLIKFNSTGVIQWEQYYPDNTLQAIAINGSDMYLGGALQSGTTSFGTMDLQSSNNLNTAFLIKGDLDGVYDSIMVATHSFQLSTKEGTYYASGTFNHPINGPRVINLNKSLTGFDEDSLVTTVGDLASTQGELILTIRPDDSVAINGLIYSEFCPVVATAGLENRYDPVEEKFYLNYEYTAATGTRYISEILTKTNAYSGFGSTIADVAVADDGNLIIVGGHSTNLTMNNITIEKTVPSYYNFIGRCDNNFYFEWLNSSNSLVPGYDTYNHRYRVFIDEAGKMYEYGMIPNSFTFGSVQISPNAGQFLLRFDSAGNPEESFTLQNTNVNRIYVESSGKIIKTGYYNYEGSPSYGNIFLTHYDNYMTEEWNLYSTDSHTGTAKIAYVQHDTIGNTYVQARILGYCDFFGTVVQSNNAFTVNAKLDLNGDVLWSDIIPDLLPAQSGGTYFGPRFMVDKDQNLLTVGLFGETITIGTETLTNLDGVNDGYIIKYTQDGETDWVVQLNAEGKYEIYGITADEENNVIVSGEFMADMTILGHKISANGLDAAFLLKIDPDGNYIWAKGFPLTGTVYHSIPAADGNNNIYITLDVADYENQTITFGTVTAPKPELEATVLVKFDPSGNTQWVKTYGAVDGDPNSTSWPVNIKTDVSGNSFLWGWCQTNAVFGSTVLVNPLSNSMFYYITKINTSGDVVWAKPLYERNFSFNYGDLLDLDNEGNVYVGGHFKDTMAIETYTFVPERTNDFFAAKFDDNGEFQWIKTIPGYSYSIINAISVFQNNILSIGGYAGSVSSLGENEITYLGGSTSIVATLVGEEALILFAYPSNLYLEAQANSTDTLEIISNTSWTAESNQTWLTLSTTSGMDEEEIILTASENTSVNERYATITISGAGVTSQYVSVTQFGQGTDITEVANSSNINIYPNPNSGKFNLILDNIMSDNIRVTITNNVGVVVKDFNLSQSGKMIQEIDLGNITKGFYFIQLRTDEVKIIKSFIVN